MNKYDVRKFCLLILAVICIVQGILLITGNSHLYAINIDFGVFEVLEILFWCILAFDIGIALSEKVE